MGIYSDQWIRRMAVEKGMIEPFAEGQVISYGYDVRVSDEIKVFTVVDPKAFDKRSFIDMKTDERIIPSNSFTLSRSVEYFSSKLAEMCEISCVDRGGKYQTGITIPRI